MPGRRDLLKAIPAIAAAGVVGGGIVAAESQNPILAAPPEPEPRKLALIVLDRSGSMAPLRDATIEGINKFLDDQRREDIEIGLAQFDSTGGADNARWTSTFSFTPSTSTPRLTHEMYEPRGNTPLLWAVATAIENLEKVMRPTDKALVVVQTDGHENSSPRELTRAIIKDMIDTREKTGNWTFAFLGADIDAWGEGSSFGTQAGSTIAYVATGAGTGTAWNTTSTATQNWSVRGGRGMPSSFYSNDTVNASLSSQDFDNLTQYQQPTSATPATTDTDTGKKKSTYHKWADIKKANGNRKTPKQD